MKNQKIKIYLQYPWKFPDSPYYKYLIDNPPENVEYLNVKKQKGVITNKKRLGLSNFSKRIIRELIKKMRIPLVNAHKTKQRKKYDLIHCAHCLSKNNFPWVADLESVWQLYVSAQKTKAATKKIKKILSNKNCRKIILWTKRTEEEFNETFPEIKNKTTIVYPAVPLPEIKKKQLKGVNLLFVGRSFYEKGGLDALRVIDYLTKRYDNVRAVIVSKVPKEILERYSLNKKVKFFGLMPKEELEKVYSNTDIFIYPGYTDTFGFGILECMSWGIPVISVEGAIKKDSKRELIQDGITGFLISSRNKGLGKIKFVWSQAILLSEIERKENPEIIREMIKKTSELIENPVLRKKMSKNCIHEIKEGKFSINEQNRKLRKIYEKALNKNL